MPCLVRTGPFGSQLHADEYVQGGWPVVNPSNISHAGLVPDSSVTVADGTRNRLRRHLLGVGDIVFGRRGELGRAALVSAEQAGWLCGTGSVVVRLRGDALRPGYLLQILRSPAVRHYFTAQAVGSTMANLNTSILLAMPLLLPSVEEQDQLVVQVSELRTVAQNGVTAALRLTDLVEERKQALITACVTGQFDVTSVARRRAPSLDMQRQDTLF